MSSSLKTNILCLYLIKLSKWFLLIMPIAALFYAANGLSAFDIYLLQAIYSLSVALLEIPSGYMADIIGRKKSLCFGALTGTVGYLIYAVSSGFEGFLVAEIILGLGGSFISGSDSAMLFDSLAGMKQENRYLQLEGRITSLGNFAETIAAVCGGLLAAAFSYRGVYIVQFIVTAIAVPAAFMLVEPPREKSILRPSFGHIIAVCNVSLFRDKVLSAALLFSSITGISTLSMAWTAQVYFVDHGLTEATITPLWVALNLLVGVVAAFAARVTGLLGRKAAIGIVAVVMPTGFVLLGSLPLLPALAALFCFYAIRGYATPLLKDLVNMACSSEVRATVLSLRNMLIRIGFAVVGPSIGFLAKGHGLSTALQIVGSGLLFFSLCSVGFLFFSRRENNVLL